MILDFKKQENLLSRYEIKRPLTFFATKKEEVACMANKAGYPLALKVFSNEIFHRTEKKGVYLNIGSEKEARETANKLFKIPKSQGVIIQKQIEGIELVVGAKKDPSFGAAIMFGTGGVMVEVISDVVFKIAPIGKKDAKEMINETRAKIFLKGFRGMQKVKEELVIDLLVKTSNLAYKEKVQEIDFNPVIANKDGVFVCDAKIKI